MKAETKATVLEALRHYRALFSDEYKEWHEISAVITAIGGGGAWEPDANGLLPCPFCNSVAFVDMEFYDCEHYWVECSECGAQSNGYPEGKAEAIAAWNRRTTAPQPDDKPMTTEEIGIASGIWDKHQPDSEATQQPAAWEQIYPPEWDKVPWANYACLVAYTSHFDGITFRWTYWECEPEWGETSYNWVDGKHGITQFTQPMPLKDVFDTRTTLRARPSEATP